MLRSTVEVVGKDTDPDIIYYNADIIADATNPSNLGLNKDPVIRFQETRSSPLINDISKYDFSIVRFTMNGSGKDLPLFIPSIQIGQPDINLSVYSVSLTATIPFTISTGTFTQTFTAQRFVEYVSETDPYNQNAVPLPNAPLTEQDIRGTYYYVYTYQHWVDLVNQAIEDCLNDALPAVAGSYHPTESIKTQLANYYLTVYASGTDPATAPPIQTQAPYITYDANTGLFSLLADTYGYGGSDSISGVTPPVPAVATGTNWTAVGTELFDLYFNTNMFGLFTNFNNIYVGAELPNGLTNKIIVQNKKGTNIRTITTLPTFPTVQPIGTSTKSYFVIEQDYASTGTLWSPIASIVFCSTMIPIYPEEVGTPLKYGTGNDNAPVQSTPAFSPIITDISIATGGAEDYRGFIEYIPSGEYRISSFTGSHQELRNIDIQVFYKLRLNQQLVPITMFNLSSVSIKVMFRKKAKFQK